MSLATLTVSAAILTKYWSDFRIPLPSVIVILITGIACSNVFGVRVRSAPYPIAHSFADHSVSYMETLNGVLNG
jgi:hypothetical protein